MRALSIRQPCAELLLRGVKPSELRSRSTSIVGERFYIYASKKWSVVSGQSSVEERKKIWSRDLATSGQAPPQWMLELAERLILDKLPTGVIVGSAVIERCVPAQ